MASSPRAMTQLPDVRISSTIDRPLGWLIAVGGCIVILDQTAFRLQELGDWASWWNIGAFVVVAGIVVLAVGGLVLPTRLLTIVWWGLPTLYIALQATWMLGYHGTSLDAAVPWLWTVEPPIVTLLLLLMRPVAAVITTLMISSVPALSSLMILGTVPYGVLHETPIQLGNVVYVAVFIGVRYQLTRLRALEREAHRQQRRQIRAAVVAEQHAKLSRVVHDEVLSVLSSAMQTVGGPPTVLRRAAARTLVALDESAGGDEPGAELIPVREAVALVAGRLRMIDEDCTLNTRASEGAVRRDLAETVSLAAAEALRNSVRHAGHDATRSVRLALSPERVRVVVEDDGVGFEASASRSGMGIPESIMGRMKEIGGSASVRSHPGQGTEVVISWPT